MRIKSFIRQGVFAAALLVISGGFTAPGDAALVKIATFGKNPGNLEMFVHISAHPKKNSPLVVVMHGCTQDARTVAEQSGWNKIADEFGFDVIYPQQKFINNANNCFNWFLSSDTKKNSGECASVKAMVDYVLKNYSIDTTRIFITGLSAGAAMSVAMMSDYPSLFKAGAIFAGGAYGSANNPFEAFSAMSGSVHKTPEEWKALVKNQNPGYHGKFPCIFIWQGSADPVVNKRNAGELLKQWTALHNADTIPDSTITGYSSQKDLTKKIFRDSSGNIVVTEYLMEGAGHALPVHPGDCDCFGGTTGMFAVDLGFHSTWMTAVDFELTGISGIVGDTVVPRNQKNLIYTLHGYPSGHSTSWVLPEGCTLLSPADDTVIKVNWDDQPGIIKARQYDLGNCLHEFALPVHVK